MFRRHAILLLFAAPLMAQDQASTLARLTDSSPAVAVVRVLRATDPDSLHHRVLFATEDRLKGQLPLRFEITEPAGRGCGRALHGLVQGTWLVAFVRWDSGQVRLSVSSARSLAPAAAELVDHVRGLVRIGAGAGRAGLLAEALSSSNRRVRQDAALSLPILPDLQRADRGARARMTAALPEFLQRGDPAFGSLVMAVVRLGLEDGRDILLSAYLEDRQPGLAPLLRKALLDMGAAETAQRVMAQLPDDPPGRERAVVLLEAADLSTTRQALRGLVSDPAERVAVRAATALLKAGARRRDLEELAGEELLDRASRRLVTPPRFRSILRGGGR